MKNIRNQSVSLMQLLNKTKFAGKGHFVALIKGMSAVILFDIGLYVERVAIKSSVHETCKLDMPTPIQQEGHLCTSVPLL